MVTSNSSKAIDSFLEYFKEAKPYHTKLLEVIEEYRFVEQMYVCTCENLTKDITIINTPLCKQTGFGLDYDDNCGYDAIDCCDLFDCDGGYGYIFDNSDLLVEESITSINETAGSVSVFGNQISDVRIQVEKIVDSNTAVLKGDATNLLNRHSIFLYVNVLQFEVTSNTGNTIILDGNQVGFVKTKDNFRIEGSETRYNGHYTIRSANYNPVNDKTEVNFVFHTLIVPDDALQGVNVQFRNSNPNTGIYQVDSFFFDGSNTVVQISGNSFNHINIPDEMLGSFQFRTGLHQFREVDIVDAEDNYHTILYTEYNYPTNETVLYLDGDVSSYEIGVDTVKLFGYFFGSGYDGEEECTKPKDTHIYSLMEEQLSIIINDNLIQPTPTPTLTPTPTPTPSLTPPAGLLVNTVQYETMTDPAQSLSISDQSIGHRGFTLSQDGTRFYASGNTTQGIYQYDLSVPWDLNSSTYNSIFLDISGTINNILDVQFNGAGTRVFALGEIVGAGILQEYILGTAWDLGSVTGMGNSFTFPISIYPDSMYKMQFSPDGSKLIVGDLGFPNGILYEFVLSTPWDVSTMNSTGTTNEIIGNGVNGFYITDDGGTMYVPAPLFDAPLFKYILTTPWDISTMQFVRNMYATKMFEGFYINENLGYLYGAESGSGPYKRLDFATVVPSNATEIITTGSYGFANVTYGGDADFNNVLPGTSYRLGGLTLTDNGSKMIIFDASRDYMYMIGLSTPYDISTAVTILDRKSFRDFETNPVVNSTTISVGLVNGVNITPDGSRLFVLLEDFSREYMVIQYDLSTPNLLGSASPVNLYNFTSDIPGDFVSGIEFADGGTRMYAISDNPNLGGYSILQYSLTVPYDIGTMSLVTVHDTPLTPLVGFPVGISMAPGGESFLVGVSNNSIEEYTLSVPYDIATISNVPNIVVDLQAIDPQFTNFSGGNGDSFYYDSVTNRLYIASSNRVFQLILG